MLCFIAMNKLRNRSSVTPDFYAIHNSIEIKYAKAILFIWCLSWEKLHLKYLTRPQSYLVENRARGILRHFYAFFLGWKRKKKNTRKKYDSKQLGHMFAKTKCCMWNIMVVIKEIGIKTVVLKNIVMATGNNNFKEWISSIFC